MRKTLKQKRRCCGLCKPHKRGWANRWKPQDRYFVSDTVLAREIEAEAPAPPVWRRAPACP